KNGFDGLLSGSGLERKNSPDGGVLIRVNPGDTGPMVYLNAVQDDSGAMLPNALEILARRTFSESLDVDKYVAQMKASRGLETTDFGELQLEMLTASDPVAVLTEFAKDNPAFRMYRVGSTDKLWPRLLFLLVVDELSLGTSPENLPVG